MPTDRVEHRLLCVTNTDGDTANVKIKLNQNSGDTDRYRLAIKISRSVLARRHLIRGRITKKS